MSRRAAGGLLAALALLALAASAGCAARRQRARAEVAVLAPEAAYAKALAQLGAGHLRRARSHLEKIPFTAESRPVLEPLVRLALADAAFYTGDDLSLVDARSKYLDFVTYYGDHPKAPYAQLQAGVSSLKQARHPSRDQSDTRVALADLRDVERRWPASPYVRAARDMISLAEAKLAEHEFIVGRFYYQKKAYVSAAGRFRRLLEDYPRYRSREKVYFYLGQALVRTGNAVEGRVYLDKLVADYPNGRYAEQVRKVLGAASPAEGANGRL